MALWDGVDFEVFMKNNWVGGDGRRQQGGRCRKLPLASRTLQGI
jgi:hypothetical protein